jgi:protease I
MKALMLIAKNNFRDEEYFITKEELEKNNIVTVTASNTLDKCKSMFGKTVIPDILLKETDANEYEAIIFIGGSGSTEYFNDSNALNFAKKSYELGKIVAAICIAPIILANSGILKAKRATVFESLAKKLTLSGAKYIDENFVVDNKIITADCSFSSRAFAREIIKALKKIKH